jgi:hypothetical protein
MANKLNGFLDNFFSGALNPKGNVGDFAHAARLYVDNAFRLAPKAKFLYFVNFNFTESVLQNFPKLDQRHRAELNMLCKSVDLPQYTATVDTKNQYNRKKNIQTRIDYQPVSITMHDDNVGITTMLMEAYYRYYYRDSNISNITATYDPRSTYKESNGRSYRFGLDNDKMQPFFRDIKLYQFSRHEYVEYTLVNPLITQWGHDTMDQTDGTGIAENKMTINYEAVLYGRGAIGEDSPATFATSHYDKTPSPLSVSGGGLANLFGGGGVLDGASSVLGDITNGNIGLGTLLTAANTVKNAKNLSLDSIKQEGFSILSGAIQKAAQTPTPGGVENTYFGKTTGNGTQTTPAVSNAAWQNPDAYAAKVNQARANNNLSTAQTFPAPPPAQITITPLD